MLLAICLALTNFSTVIEAVSQPVSVDPNDFGSLPESGYQPENELAPEESTGLPEPSSEETYDPDGGLIQSSLPPVSGELNLLSSDILTHTVSVKINPVGDGMPAKTGDVQYVNVSAFNDNPNDIAFTTVRIFFQPIAPVGVRYDPAHYDVRPVDAEASIMIDANLSGGLSDPADSNVSKIVGRWVKATPKYVDEVSYKGSQYSVGTDLNCLEFSLPAGSSVSFDVPVTVDAGYYGDVGAVAFYEWERTDADPSLSEYYQGSSKGSASAVINPNVPPYYVSLEWNGDIKWDNFLKSVNDTSAVFKNNKFLPEELVYSFSVDNMHAGSANGSVFPATIALSDTLTLPEGITLPVGVPTVETAYDPDGTERLQYKIDGNVIYEIIIAPHIDMPFEYTGNIESLNDKSVSFTMTVSNTAPDELKAFWNPLGVITSSLHLNSLSVTEVTKELEIINNAAVNIKSVDTYNYDDTFNSSCTVKITPDSGISVSKSIVTVYDSNGNDRSKVSAQNNTIKDREGRFIVGDNYVIEYRVEAENRGEFPYINNGTFTVSDTADPALHYITDDYISSHPEFKNYAPKKSISNETFIEPGGVPMSVNFEWGGGNISSCRYRRNAVFI